MSASTLFQYGRRLASLVVVVAIALGSVGPAGAQPGAREDAQALFAQALTLIRAGKFAEACPLLQKSQKLEPAMGTQYRLAECYEGAGLVGSAYVLYMEVAEAARKTQRADREAQARERADALRARLPMLTVTLPQAVADTPGLEVKRDGEPVERVDWNRSTPVDPGAHTIMVSAPGKKEWRTTVRSLEGGRLEIAVPALESEAAPAPAAVPPPAAGPPPPAPSSPETSTAATGRGQRIGAIVAASVGTVGLGLGITFGVLASSKWNETIAHCQNHDPTACDSTGIQLAPAAGTLAAVSTTGFIVAGAGFATGGILWFTAPKRPSSTTGWRLAPSVGPSSAGAAMEGRF